MFEIKRLDVDVPADILQTAVDRAFCYGQSIDTYTGRAITVRQYLGSFGISETVELSYKSHILPVHLPRINESEAALKPLDIAMPQRSHDTLTAAAKDLDISVDSYVSHSLDVYDTLHAYYGVNEATIIMNGISHTIVLRPGNISGLTLVN